MICVSQLTALSDNVFCIQISYAYSPFTFWLKIGKSPVFQCITVTGWYTGPRLLHAPISLCGVNLCTLVDQNLPDSDCAC